MLMLVVEVEAEVLTLMWGDLCLSNGRRMIMKVMQLRLVTDLKMIDLHLITINYKEIIKEYI